MKTVKEMATETHSHLPKNQWRSSADPGAAWSRAVRTELTLRDIAYGACHRALHTVGAQAMC